MIIGGYAIGAHEGYVYVRAEYPLAVKRLRHGDRRRRGARPAGRQHPRHRLRASTSRSSRAPARSSAARRRRSSPPSRASAACRARGRRSPRSAASGASPRTSTTSRRFANVPWIITNGADAFAALGTETSKGTKVFASPARSSTAAWSRCPWAPRCATSSSTSAAASRTARSSRPCRSAAPPAAACRRTCSTRRSTTRASPRPAPSIGSGGMVVVDEDTCMVDLAQVLPRVHPERELRQVRPLPRRHQAHARDPRAHHRRRRRARATSSCSRSMGHDIIEGTLCAPRRQRRPTRCSPRSRYFRDEYEAHIREKRCPAGVCKALITYYIDAEACTGCMLCAKKCPTAVHHRRAQAAARDRPWPLHQVRHLPPGLQVRRRPGGKGSPAPAGRRQLSPPRPRPGGSSRSTPAEARGVAPRARLCSTWPAGKASTSRPCAAWKARPPGAAAACAWWRWRVSTSCRLPAPPGSPTAVVQTETPRVRARRESYLGCTCPTTTPTAKHPCTHACPTHIDIPGYLAALAAGDAAGAAAIVREEPPFPGILGRVCPRYCEPVCRRGDVDEPIAICALHRAAADHTHVPLAPGTPTGQASRHHRRRPGRPRGGLVPHARGHQVTLYDAQTSPAAPSLPHPRVPPPRMVLDAICGPCGMPASASWAVPSWTTRSTPGAVRRRLRRGRSSASAPTRSRIHVRPGETWP